MNSWCASVRECSPDRRGDLTVGERKQGVATRELSTAAVAAAPEVVRTEEWDAVFVLRLKEEPFVAPTRAVVVRLYLRIDLAEDRRRGTRQRKIVRSSNDHDRRKLAWSKELNPHGRESVRPSEGNESASQFARRQIVVPLSRRNPPSPLDFAPPVTERCPRVSDGFL